MAKMPYDVFPLRLPLEAEAFREGLQEKRLRLMRCDSWWGGAGNPFTAMSGLPWATV